MQSCRAPFELCFMQERDSSIVHPMRKYLLFLATRLVVFSVKFNQSKDWGKKYSTKQNDMITSVIYTEILVRPKNSFVNSKANSEVHQNPKHVIASNIVDNVSLIWDEHKLDRGKTKKDRSRDVKFYAAQNIL